MNGYNRHKCRCLECKAAKSAYEVQWRQLNPDKQKARRSRWAKLNPDKIKAQRARWRQLHQGEIKAHRAQWRQLNQGKEKAANALWAKLNRSKKKAASARRLQLHPEKVKEYAARWCRLHPVKIRAMKARRRARKMNAPGFCTEEQLEARIAFYGWRCWMCRAPYEAIDHVISLAKGGSNWPANLRPACKSCNSRKGASGPDQFVLTRPPSMKTLACERRRYLR